MWPIWLIAVIVAGGILMVVSTAVLAVYIDRKRRRNGGTVSTIDRNLSQYNRAHLSINDVDVASLPRPTQSLRQSLGHMRRDSRFYSLMPSEEDVKKSAEQGSEKASQRSPNRETEMVKRPQQWLSPMKSKTQSRKKKSIKLSISAPMAKDPAMIGNEASAQLGMQPVAPVELPAETSPKAAPQSVVPGRPNFGHTGQLSLDTKSDSHCATDRPNTIILRSTSLGSIKGPPPDCPLPPVPADFTFSHIRGPSVVKSKSEVNIHRTEMSVLNSSVETLRPGALDPALSSQKRAKKLNGFSAFDFGLEHDSLQVIKVDTSNAGSVANSPQIREATRSKALYTDKSYNTPSPSLRSLCSQSRPVSSLSLSERWPAPVANNKSSTFESRPISVCSSVDMFRNSIVGAHAPHSAPESPRTKGHKRQNCIRISGLTPVDQSKKRLSSQLQRLAEAEETDGEDERSLAIEIPTISPARPSTTALHIQKFNANSLDVPTLKPVKLPPNKANVAIGEGNSSSSGVVPRHKPLASVSSQQKLYTGLTSRAQATTPRFVYQGSPSSDPSRPAPPPQQFSPVSPSCKPRDITKRLYRAGTTYSPASQSMLDSNTPSIANSPFTGNSSPYRSKTQLHGPRNIPAPSLRTRNRTSPRVRQRDRSGSPIRKASVTGTRQASRSATSEDIKRSLVLLQTLTHAAKSTPGLPEMNIVPSQNLSRVETTETKSSENDRSQVPRQRSRTMGSREPPSMFEPPRFRPQGTYPLQHNVKNIVGPSSSTISIWEDESVRDSTETTRLDPTRHSPQLQKDSLWRLQQNADIITSRALAQGSQSNKTISPKMMKNAHVLESYWGMRPDSKEEITRKGSTDAGRHDLMSHSPRMRKRSHTVAARPYIDKSIALEGYDVVGLGVNFGRTGLASTFSSGMERDGIENVR